MKETTLLPYELTNMTPEEYAAYSVYQMDINKNSSEFKLIKEREEEFRKNAFKDLVEKNQTILTTYKLVNKKDAKTKGEAYVTFMDNYDKNLAEYDLVVETSKKVERNAKFDLSTKDHRALVEYDACRTECLKSKRQKDSNKLREALAMPSAYF